MIQVVPHAQVPIVWPQAMRELSRAVKLDPERNLIDVLDELMSGYMTLWRVSGVCTGWVVTQVTKAKNSKRCFWAIYAAGAAKRTNNMRLLMAELEATARTEKCTVFKFQGRDWRRVFPEFAATPMDNGRWQFRKVLK